MPTARPRRAPTGTLLVVVAVLLALLPVGGAGAQTATPAARDVDEGCHLAPPSGFEDAPGGESGEAIDCIAYYGVTQGRTPTTYDPSGRVLRDQMASFMMRTAEVAGVVLPEDVVDAFPDDEGNTHEPRIDQAAATEVAEGFDDGTYRPAVEVTRAQMASFVGRMIELVIGQPLDNAGNRDFFDDDDGHEPHERMINELAAVGIVQGVAAGGYDPKAPVTREQMALFLARTLDFLVEEHGKVLAPLGLGGLVDGPELVAAAVVDTESDTATVGVAFRFDEPVTTTIARARLGLYSFAGEKTAADSATRAADDRRIVVARFPAASVPQATTAAVESGAVQDDEGNLSPEGSAPLHAMSLPGGATAAPDLLSVTDIDADNGMATFTFDEPAFVMDSGGYHLVLDDGTTLTSESATGNDSTRHVARFAGLTEEQADSVARGYVDAGAVSDAAADGNPNPQQAADVTDDGQTDSPDLEDFLILDGDTDTANATVIRYVFDEAVDLVIDPTPVFGGPTGVFRAYDINGAEVESSDAEEVTGENRFIDVTFAEGEISELTVGVSVDADSVTSTVNGNPNAVDELGKSRSFAAGETAAPDLVRVASSADGIVFTFDAPVVVQDDGGFAAYDTDGVRHSLADCEAGEADNQVTCTAPEQTEPAIVLGGVERGAVSDTGETLLNPPSSGEIAGAGEPGDGEAEEAEATAS